MTKYASGSNQGKVKFFQLRAVTDFQFNLIYLNFEIFVRAVVINFGLIPVLVQNTRIFDYGGHLAHINNTNI